MSKDALAMGKLPFSHISLSLISCYLKLCCNRGRGGGGGHTQKKKLKKSTHTSWLNHLKNINLLEVPSSFSSTPLWNVQTSVHRRPAYTPKRFEEITRVIIRMCFLQESAIRMNGLHESNSKLNIRSYPKAKKTDSDLILLLLSSGSL